MRQERLALAVVIVLAILDVMPRLASASLPIISATRVIGQPDFVQNTADNGGLSAHSLHSPTHAILDTAGDLYVADTFNNRVLEYDAPLSSGMNASRVFGQADFNHNSANRGGSLSAGGLVSPEGLALDKQGNLYVVDQGNNRVLEYDAPLTSGMAASHVVGQPDFTHDLANNGGLSAASIQDPYAVAVDKQGHLYVDDLGNQRVLEYDHPLTTSVTADRVFGQPDFIHNVQNNGGLSATSLRGPDGVAVDTQGNLYVADGNNRVLEYTVPLTTGMAAGLVFGQPNFTSNTANHGGLSATSLGQPDDVAVDTQGNLYVADTANQRVLKYSAPLSSDMAASQVYGQPDFTSNTVNNGGVSSHSLQFPTGVALDAQANLYIADFGNHRVLGYGPAPAYLWLPLVVR